jgi:hypothetical protein
LRSNASGDLLRADAPLARLLPPTCSSGWGRAPLDGILKALGTTADGEPLLVDVSEVVLAREA